jgi:hypothetical protein
MEPTRAVSARTTVNDIALGVFVGLWTFVLSVAVLSGLAVVALTQLNRTS